MKNIQQKLKQQEEIKQQVEDALKKLNSENFNLNNNIKLLSQCTEESEQAQKWFMLSAEQGNTYAQYNLGWLMQKGEVENASPYAARYYFELACKGGLEKACFALENQSPSNF
ncbi:tetratricopeptide repeat protein [Providencia sp. PROV266]|uniref:tetratricopeptide repeat protein n=1 Tax=Providencia sp. PROV266 TaxID=2949954 RepID=UPI00234B4880|nr:hypothetical protein [Providencia sp. PROV266]